jgi:hypothetical protein
VGKEFKTGAIPLFGELKCWKLSLNLQQQDFFILIKSHPVLINKGDFVA